MTASPGQINITETFVRHRKMSDELKIPLLVWVDDHANRGWAYTLLSHARELGVQVYTFKSTLETEKWIEHNIGTNPPLKLLTNADFLRNHDGAPKGIRFVTDVVRYEQGEDGMKLDPDAGFKVTRYIRDRLSSAPILVRTHSNNLTNTKFVREYSLTGSTCEDGVVRLYIDALAGVAEDNEGSDWAKYNASM